MDYKLSIHLRYKYKKNTVYGCDSGTQNILWALGYTYPMMWGKETYSYFPPNKWHKYQMGYVEIEEGNIP